MSDGFLAYLIFGMSLWLLSHKGYMTRRHSADPWKDALGNIIVTASIIVLWPLAWGAIVILSFRAALKGRQR